MFAVAVWEPAAGAPTGLARVEAICDAWVAYLADPPFRGGCFLTTATVEFDGRPGRVRDAVIAQTQRWLGVLSREVSRAVDAGELAPETDPSALAVSLWALATGANCHVQLLGDCEVLSALRATMATVITAARAG